MEGLIAGTGYLIKEVSLPAVGTGDFSDTRSVTLE